MAAVLGRHDCRVLCKCEGVQAAKASSDGADVSCACVVLQHGNEVW